MINLNELESVKPLLSFWDKLSDTETALIENKIKNISYDKGVNIHSADSKCLGVFIIKEGGLRVYILSEDGREVTLYRLSAGEVCVLSASCILNSITFDVHIDTEEETKGYLIDSGTFSTLCSRNVYVENFAYKNTMERFSDVMWAMEQILFLSIDKRLAIFLRDELIKTNSDILHITQEQIAKYIGSAREVVSRMLKVFQEDGILKLSRGAIRIVNRDKLKEICL